MGFTSLEDPGFWFSEPDDFLGKLSEGLGVRFRSILLNDPQSAEEVQVCLFDLPPHTAIPTHFHNTARFEIVLSGEITVGGDLRRAGDIMLADAGEAYGPLLVGPEGCRTLEIFACGPRSGGTVVGQPEELHRDFPAFMALVDEYGPQFQNSLDTVEAIP